MRLLVPREPACSSGCKRGPGHPSAPPISRPTARVGVGERDIVSRGRGLLQHALLFNEWTESNGSPGTKVAPVEFGSVFTRKEGDLACPALGRPFCVQARIERKGPSSGPSAPGRLECCDGAAL